MLNVLKKYMLLKENFLNNRQKYKSILYLLSKIRKNNLQQNDLEDNTMNKIEELLNNQNLENIDLNSDVITSEEKEELKNFDVSEELLKDIECSLMLKIKQLFQEEKEDDINEKNDEKDKNNIIINKDELEIEKNEHIEINGSSINLNKEKIEDKKE